MKAITEMNREEILALSAADINQRPEPCLTAGEVIHMARTLGAFWSYDYDAAKAGRVGMHVLLKSGRHSDGFFVSRIFLEPKNIRKIIARQMVMKLYNFPQFVSAEWVAGVPDGATLLGTEVALLLRTPVAKMVKESGRIRLVCDRVRPGDRVLLVEDFCTRGTGFLEAVIDILAVSPAARVLPYDLVIINRGGLKQIGSGASSYGIISVVEYCIQDWAPEECPLCRIGSRAIKPKETDENWRELCSSQK